MMNINSASKSTGQNEKRNEQVRRLPVRMHELLGIPKSTGKKKKVDGLTIDNPLPQPVRIKDLFGSASCKKITNTVSARRMTTLPSAARRQLYNDDPRDRTSYRNVTTISSGSCTVNKTFVEINSNVKSQTRPESVKLLGLSRSDGKINKATDLGRERLKPERMKDFMESWEKIQTVQPPARKFTTAQMCTTNARKKLYSALPHSPSTTSKINRKSPAQKKFQTQKNVIPDAKIIKSQATRKSCLLPPNSIRNKYVNNRQNETIKEELPSLIDNSQSRKIGNTEIQNDEKMDSNDKNRLNTTTTIDNDDEESLDGNYESGNSDEMIGQYEISANNQIDNFEKSMSLEKANTSIDAKESFENSVKNIDNKVREIDDSTKIPRPSVIMGISAKGMRKDIQSLASGSEKSSYEISRPPLRELSRHSVLLQPRLDGKPTSLEDLLGNSHYERGESFYRENLPPDSFLENAEKTKNSFVNMDIQTLSWMHGNLKLVVQSTEENLFSMKLMLQAMEDVMKNYTNLETEESRKTIDNCNLLPPTILVVETIDDEESRIYQGNNVDVQISKKKLEIPFVNEELVVAGNGNENDSPILKNPEEENKENINTKNNRKVENNGEKPRRRSLRIAEKNAKSPKRLDDSFSQIEDELNIVHIKTKKETPRAGKSSKSLDPRSRRSIREYMALKSTMNFLDTPDVKGLPTLKGEKDTPSHRRATRRSLSRKLLTELDDLYAESPL